MTTRSQQDTNQAVQASVNSFNIFQGLQQIGTEKPSPDQQIMHEIEWQVS